MKKVFLYILIVLFCFSLYSDYCYFNTHSETMGIIREIQHTDKYDSPTPTNTLSRVVYEVDGIQYNGFISKWNGTFKVNKEITIFYSNENPYEFNYIYQINHLRYSTLFVLFLILSICIFMIIPSNKTINRLLKGTYLYRKG